MEKGLEVKEQVKNQLSKYSLQDNLRLEQVKKMLEGKGDNWDKSVITKDGYDLENLTLLLAYEYCLSTEIITDGRISFEKALNKLSQIDKFRLGEPKIGDAIITYGKSVDDPEAMSIVSEKYDDQRRTTGAQYTDYVGEDGKLRSAVFIFSKKLLKDGNYTTGMDFDDLSDIRQTTFHEWNHNAEKEFIEINEKGENPKIERKYTGPDGKVYINYNDVKQYRLPIFKKGVFVRMSESYEMEKGQRIGISQGLSTREETSKGIIMHNQITEGFVEMYARQMVLAIDPNAKIDQGKYYEHTKIAQKIDVARDKNDGKGKTAADFLSHSTILKNELEEIIVNYKKDGLHYVADYVDNVRSGKTKKSISLREFGKIAERIGLSKNQIQKIQENDFWKKDSFTKTDVSNILKVFKKYINNNEMENNIYEDIMQNLDLYIKAVKEEKKFFDNIPVILGYNKFEKNVKKMDDSDDVFEY